MTKKASDRDQQAGKARGFTMDRRTMLKTTAVSLAAVGLGASAMPGPTHPLGFCPIIGTKNDIVTLFGPDFGSSFEDVSARFSHSMFGHPFLWPSGFSGGELLTTITALPFNLSQAPIETVIGEGYHSMPSNLPSGLAITTPIRTWLGNGGSRYKSFQKFSFPYTTLIHSCSSFWGGLDHTGKLSIDFFVPKDFCCCPISPVGHRWSLRFYAATAGNAFEIEYQASLILTGSLYPWQIADALCTVLTSAFQSNFTISLMCQATHLFDDQANITIGAPSGEGPFVKGAIHVEVDRMDDSAEFDSVPCDSVDSQCCDSLDDDSLPCDSLHENSIPDHCPSIEADFHPFIFS